MAFLAAQRLPRSERFGNQTNTLIHLDVVAYDGRLAHHCSGAMIHEKMRTDGSPGWRSIPVRACAIRS